MNENLNSLWNTKEHISSNCHSHEYCKDIFSKENIQSFKELTGIDCSNMKFYKKSIYDYMDEIPWKVYIDDNSRPEILSFICYLDENYIQEKSCIGNICVMKYCKDKIKIHCRDHGSFLYKNTKWCYQNEIDNIKQKYGV